MLNNPYRLVVFDWEGTLSDTFGEVIHILSTQVKERHGLALDEIAARHLMPCGLLKTLQKVLPKLSHEAHDALMLAVQKRIGKDKQAVFLIPGAKQLIEKTFQQGITLAIATGMGGDALTRALKAADLSSFFSCTACAGDAPPKPSPVMLQTIMAECGVTPDQTLMVGDSIVDVEMAKFAGVDVVGVDFYHQHADTLMAAGAIKVYDDYQDLSRGLGLSSK